MQYVLRCECGRQLVVSDGVPGLTITCGCGRVLRLSDGRRGGFSDEADALGLPAADFWRTLFQLTPRCYLTQAIFWLNIAVFAVMVLMGVHPFSPSGKDLIAWGANYGPSTLNGQYWRLFTCIFLHIGVLHIACNMWALWSIGFMVERLLGNAGFLIVYLISGLVGSLAMLFWNPASLSAGASGAIFGLIGALFGFIILRNDTVPPRILKSLRSNSLFYIGINLVFTMTMPGIGVAAHVGGLIAGFVCGLALSQPVTPLARRTLRNLMVAAGGALVIGGSFLFLPQPVTDMGAERDFFSEHEKKPLEILKKAKERLKNGEITDAQFADILEKEVIPEWRQLTDRVNEIQNVRPDQQRMHDLLLAYATAHLRGWELRVEGIRNNNDPEKLKAAAAQEKLANEAVGQLNKLNG